MGETEEYYSCSCVYCAYISNDGIVPSPHPANASGSAVT